ncbi:MAG: LamB/YcsF family protein [Rhodospirillales bacterium]
MTARINLNADLGEGVGTFAVGDDEALLGIVGTASIACGFHGGDPAIMFETCRLAASKGVSIGAHPGYADLQGFGRRAMNLSEAEVENIVAYQIGALQAVAALSDLTLTHVKAHGALYNAAAAERGLALAIGRAIKAVDGRLIYLALASSEMERAAIDLALPLAREAFIDRAYDSKGHLVPRAVEGAVIHDPLAAAERAVSLATEGRVTDVDGGILNLAADSLCLHGDTPGAVEQARACAAALDQAGVARVGLPEMIGR